MPSNLREILHVLFFTPWKGGRWGVPAVLVGPPGAAKTSEVVSVAVRDSMPVETVLGATREPTDVAGLPTVAPDADAFDYLPARFLRRLSDHKRGVLFLDELNSSPPAVQAALMRGILEGVFGDFTLPPHIRIIGAMNPTECSAGGFEIAPPMANRLTWLSVDYPSVAEWAGYMMGSEELEIEIDAEAEEARVTAAWAREYTLAKSRAIGFLNFKPDSLARMPNPNLPAAGRAWPSPRSWETATRLIASAKIHNVGPRTRDTLIGGTIGEAVGSELTAYLETASIADPYDVLDGKIAWSHDARRLDLTYAIVGGIAAAVIETHKQGDAKLTRERGDRAWRILEPIASVAKDVVVEAAKKLARAELGIAGLPSAKPVITGLHAYLAATR